MEIHCKTSYGIKPDLLDRLSGLKLDSTVCSVRLWLIESGSKESVSNNDLVQVFGSVFSRIAEGHSITLLFPHDVSELRRKLDALSIDWKKEKGGLLVEFPWSKSQVLFDVLRVTAFTTFYGWTDRLEPLPTNPSLLFQNLDAILVVGVFALYDDSVELLSKRLPSEQIMIAVRDVAADMDIPVFLDY